ncbi:hypothetical protein [Paractinoplanes toevensis]|nr:hypothetical protein [Actinoplanes toevensis]
MADAQVKRRVGKQWEKMFPGFELWRPLRLLRRIGPVLQGISLDLARSGTQYFPSAHVHPLTMKFPVVSLGLDHRLLGKTGIQRRISFDDDVDTLLAAAADLRAQSPLPLDRYPTAAEILDAYRSFFGSANLPTGPTSEIETLVLLSALSGSPERQTIAVDFARSLVKSWRHAPDGFDSADAWLENLVERADNVDALEAFVDEQAKALKVDKLKFASPFGPESR